MNKKIWFVLLSGFITLIIGSCEEIYTPKPRGYFRIDLPEKSFQTYSSDCPYTFQHPTYSKTSDYDGQATEKCWMNIEFPAFKAKIYLSYLPVKNNIDDLIEQSRSLTYKHTIKATDIKENIIIDDSSRVYGLVYDVEGNAASNIQFYLTDSTNHFLRGSLYFNEVPNYDSIAPALNFIKEDLYTLVNTFEWKN